MTTAATLNQPWQPAQKIGFRFFFLLFLLFIFFDPNAMPVPDKIFDFYISPMHKFIPWVAAHILHIAKPVTTFSGGSGDTTYDWIVLLFTTVMSALGTIIWTAVSRKPINYDRLYYWLLVLLRFYVGLTMLSYGAVKVIKLQFPSPSPYRLMEAYGDSSPMALAWTFIGYSKGYNYFTGLAELLCGVLLLFRRTTTLGAVIAFTVAANIVAINFCYDVPVKIVASALLVMTIFILMKDIRRIMDFFIYNRVAEPSNIKDRRFQKKWKNITLITVKYLFIAYMVLSTAENVIGDMSVRGDDVKRPVLYGIFNTTSFTLNKDTLTPLITDTTRWRRLVIGANGMVKVQMMNDSIRNYSFKKDTVKKLIIIGAMKDTTKKYTFNYTLSKDSTLQMNGKGPHGDVSALLKRQDEKKFLLIRRGFHWVNETPFSK